VYQKCSQSVPKKSVVKVCPKKRSESVVKQSVAKVLVFVALCSTATIFFLWQSPKVAKTRFSGHLKPRLLRPLANKTKQMAGPYMWGWAQQLHLVVSLSFCYTFVRSTNDWSPDLPNDVYASLVVRPLCLYLDQCLLAFATLSLGQPMIGPLTYLMMCTLHW
jgi:hypothetical protein